MTIRIVSTARASSVVRYFISKHHFEPADLAAVGYGDTRPVATNTNSTGRMKNRRVDIVILFSSAVEDADAGAAQATEHIIYSSEGEGVGTQQEAEETSESAATPPVETANVKPVNIRPDRPEVLKKH